MIVHCLDIFIRTYPAHTIACLTGLIHRNCYPKHCAKALVREYSIAATQIHLQIFSHIICAGCNIARRYSGPRIAERILHIAFHRKTEIIVVACNQTILLRFCIGCAAVSHAKWCKKCRCQIIAVANT